MKKSGQVFKKEGVKITTAPGQHPAPRPAVGTTARAGVWKRMHPHRRKSRKRQKVMLRELLMLLEG